MAMAPAPAARRGQPPRPRVVIPMLAAIALLLAVGAAASSSSLGGWSRPRATAARTSAATFRSVPHQPSPSAAARPQLAPSSSNAAALPHSSSLGQVAQFVAVPASRHLLAYPDPDDDERDLHGGAGDVSRVDAGPNIDAPSSASLLRLTAFAAAPARRRHLLAYEPRPRPRDPHGGAGDADAARAGAGADVKRGVGTRASDEGTATFNSSVVADPPQPTPFASPAGIAAPPPEVRLPPPETARCTFVTYIGGGAGTVELAHDGEERVFVVREHAAGRSNVSHADIAAPLILSSDEESDLEDESDCCEGYRDNDFSTAMEQFCRVLGHAVTAIDKAPWLVRLWEFFRG